MTILHWTATLLVALIGLLGIWVGHLYSRKNELEKQLAEKKRSTYNKFISSFYDYFYDLALERKTNKQRDDELLKALKEFAKEITLYGSPSVIKAFNEFRLSGIRQQKQQSQQDNPDFSVLAYFGDFLLAVREDMGLSNKSLSSKELFQILLKDDASDLSMEKYRTEKT